MSCNFTEKISSLIDGELTPSETREVERHLLNCGECQQMRVDFLNLRSQIANFETSLQPAVQNRALEKILSTQRRAPVPGLQWGFGKAVAFASLLLFAAILGLLLYRSSNSRGPQQREMQAAAQNPSPAPSVTVQQKQPEPEASPAPKKDNEETNTPRRAPSTPKRPLVREPKPGEQFAAIPEPVRSAIPEPVRPADAETMTATHFEKSETLLRAFRNLRLDEPESATEVSYERKRAQQLVYQNMMLRREADERGDVQVASLLENLEPILLDIANLPDKPKQDAVRVIRERVERKNIVALLRVNSTALARAFD